MKKLFSIGLLAGVVALFLFLAHATLFPQNSAARIVLIEPGARLSAIVEGLAKEGALAHPQFFKAWAYFTRRQNSLRAGEYEIPARATVREILSMLSGGIGRNRFATIPEGLTAKQVQVLLATFEGLTGEIPDIKDGEILPQTYAYIRGQTRAALVERMRRDMASALEHEWNNRAPGLPLNTPQEALVLASIIEKETSLDDERPLAAAVFVNRLKKGMRLQADATVVYAITNGLGDMKGKKLFLTDLRVASPYNTYENRGLPPAPIANPGLLSIRAALNPAPVDYLYFVADGTGGHKFASDLITHEKNRAAWRKVRGN